MKRKVLIFSILLCCCMCLLAGCENTTNESNKTSEDKEVTQVGKLDLEVDKIASFSEGLAMVKIDGKYGYIDNLGNTVIEPKYDKAESFSDGLALVCMAESSDSYSTNYNCGYIDTQGNIVIDLKYENGKSFIDGIAVVKSGIYGIVIDKNGNELYSNIYYVSTTVLNDGLLMVSATDADLPKEYNGQYTIIDSNNEFKSILTKGIAGTTGCANNLCSVKQLYDDNGNTIRTDSELGGKYGYVDYQGNLVIDYKYDYAETFSEDLAKIVLDGKIGFINNKGELVIDNKYDAQESYFVYPSSFSDGLVIISTTSGLVALDKTGTEVFTLSDNYNIVDSIYVNGIALIRKDKNYVFIDAKGKELFEEYNYAEGFSDGLAYVKTGDNTFEFINTSGKIIIAGTIND